MTGSSSNKAKYILAGGIFLVLLAIFAAWEILPGPRGRDGLETRFEKAMQKIQLVNSMKADLLESAEAEKSAVMADTDEASHASAQQSEQTSEALEKARRSLSHLLGEEKSPRETEAFDRFSSCWGKLRKIDSEILPLAVQNTNLKAFRLSFGPAREAIGRMETALDRLTDSSGASPDASRISTLASKAILDTYKIYALQAPHIAATSDAEMDNMEAEMKGLDRQVNEALENLAAPAGKDGVPFLDAARASYAAFHKINEQIIQLSRENSNIRSFDISLGRKRKATAECLDSLSALQDAVRQSVTFKATR
jgi:hypothetical protein